MEQEGSSGKQQESSDNPNEIMPGVQQEQRSENKESTNYTRQSPAKRIETLWSDFWYIPLKSRLTIWIELLLFVVGCFTAAVFVQQARIMQDTVIEVRNSASQTERLVITNLGQLAIAAKTAEAAKISAINAQKALALQEISERPYVDVGDIHFALNPGPNVDNDIIVGTFNDGNTPAFNFVVFARPFVSAYREMTVFDVGPIPKEIVPITLPAHTPFTGHTPMPADFFLSQDMYLIQKKVHVIYLAGYISYAEPLGNTVQRDFCSYYDPYIGTHFARCPAGFKIIKTNYVQTR